ncbi:MAG: hypothetical protein JW723_06075, partial [Bacteroidales bacterium]|nr:hypothetical protein [Bacteroidales bacterium]
MNIRRITIFSFAFFFSFSIVTSQDIEELVSKYTEENGKGYMQPLADAFGATFNTGLFHSAKMKKLGFQAYLGVVTSAAFISDKRTTFDATTQGFTDPEMTAEAPTIFGPSESVDVEGPGGTVYVFPAGMNVKMIPFAIPQLSIGSVYGTDLTFRFITFNLGEDFGDLSVFGWGIRHSISQHLDMLPVDIALGVYNQSFKVGDIASASAWLVSAQASKRVMIFTFYGGLGYENTKLDLEYTNAGEDVDIAFNLKGKNSIRLTAGVTFNFGPVKLNVDYNIASQSVLSVGLGVGI